MNVNRRNFLLFLGATAGTLTSSLWDKQSQAASQAVSQNSSSLAKTSANLGFQPIKMALPLEVEQLAIPQQIANYASYQVQDDLVLPEGFIYDLIAVWGDPVGDSRFGYNNDYLSLVETAPGEGYLTVNFEYISGGIWMQTYSSVIGEELWGKRKMMRWH
jgi:uncharacterized protein